MMRASALRAELAGTLTSWARRRHVVVALAVRAVEATERALQIPRAFLEVVLAVGAGNLLEKKQLHILRGI